MPGVKPYVWHGDDPGRDAGITQELVKIRAQARENHAKTARQEAENWASLVAQRHCLDAVEAIDGPGYEWRNELRDAL